jgi:hypothetical protein
VGIAGRVLTHDTFIQAMRDVIWNLTGHTIMRDITIATEDIILNLSVEWCLAWRDKS